MASPPDPVAIVPREPGSYLLVLRTDRRLNLAVGHLGARGFRRGWHGYTGSARRGLRARLGGHLAPARPVHWHVDALRGAGRLAELCIMVGSARIECALAARLAALGAEGGADFGSSDCRCPGHPVSFARRPPLAELRPGLTRLPLAGGLPPSPPILGGSSTAARLLDSSLG